LQNIIAKKEDIDGAKIKALILPLLGFKNKLRGPFWQSTAALIEAC
tara:strand:- start:6834 stop:6971 length:138 start_codon:yes stop_codon:yes gene_type:complete